MDSQFIARFGAPGQADGIYDSDRGALVAILSRKFKSADRFASFIGDVHFPNVDGQELSITFSQHLACRDDRLTMGFIPILEFNTLIVGQVSAILNVEEVSGHDREATRRAGIRINKEQVCKMHNEPRRRSRRGGLERCAAQIRKAAGGVKRLRSYVRP